MDERMVLRVMDELRPVYPHDDDELLRMIATKTPAGASIALRLSCADLGAVWNRCVLRWMHRIARAAAHVLQSGKHSD